MTKSPRAKVVIFLLSIGTIALVGCGWSASSTTKQSASSSTAEHSARQNATNPSQHVPAGWSDLDLTTDFGTSVGSSSQIRALACTSGPFCMILASAETPEWQALPYSSGRPGQAAPVASGVTGGVALACASASFCMLLTQTSNYYTWDGSTWTTHEGVPGNGEVASGDNVLACPANGFCLAIGQDGSQGSATVLEYTDSAWSQNMFNNDGQVLTEISCASPSYCYLLGNTGDAWRFNGSAWGGPSNLTVSDSQGSADVIDEISCAHGPYCIAVGENGGGVLVDHGSGFSPLPGIEIYNSSGANIRGACGSESFCLVQPLGSTGPTGYAILAGTHLTPLSSPPVPPTGIDLSCTADRFCMNDISNTDSVVSYSGPTRPTEPTTPTTTQPATANAAACSLPHGSEGGSALPYSASGIGCAAALSVVKAVAYSGGPCNGANLTGAGCNAPLGFVCRISEPSQPGSASPGDTADCVDGSERIELQLPG
jgi:hypothetical protein